MELSINIRMGKTAGTIGFQSGYSEVNGLKMYYEIYGKGKPLVLIHGGGSTIQSSFEVAIPFFAQKRQVIALELQSHGRTNDRNADLSFETDADDIATLLSNLKIDKADFLGFSNGGTTTIQLVIRHPEIVGKIILCSALSKRSGVPEHFWEFMKKGKLDDMPKQLKEAYRKVSSDPNGLQVMFSRDSKRMIEFTDIPDDKIRLIKSRTLIIIGDKDIVTPEHAIEMHRLISNSELAIIPGVHGECIGEVTTLQEGNYEIPLAIPLIERFLDKEA